MSFNPKDGLFIIDEIYNKVHPDQQPQRPFLKVNFENVWYNIELIPSILLWFPPKTDYFEISFEWLTFGIFFQFKRK